MELTQSLQSLKPSYIREILAAASDPAVISLAGGLPAEQAFPMPIFAQVMAQLSGKADIFQYGPTEGYAPLLDHFHHRFNLPATHKALVTTGSQQGLDLIARAYLNPGDGIVMEAPSYLGAVQVFELAQAKIIPVAQTSTGPDLAQLEQCFAKQTPKLFYAVPDFHNPTGVCWSQETRERVANLCLRYGVVLLEDAPYRELRFSGEALPMVSEYCPDQSIVLRSFSKFAAPGMRVGVITGNEAFIKPLITLKQAADLHSSIPMQALLLGLLTHDDFAQHLQDARALYRTRYQALASAIAKQLPSECEINPIEGGMFLWLKMPACDTHALAQSLMQQGVAVVPSLVFFPSDFANVSSALRLNFTSADPAALEEAVTRIAKALS